MLSHNFKIYQYNQHKWFDDDLRHTDTNSKNAALLSPLPFIKRLLIYASITKLFHSKVSSLFRLCWQLAMLLGLIQTSFPINSIRKFSSSLAIFRYQL